MDEIKLPQSLLKISVTNANHICLILKRKFPEYRLIIFENSFP